MPKYTCSELIRLTSYTNYVVRHIHRRQYIQMDKKTKNKKSEIYFICQRSELTNGYGMNEFSMCGELPAYYP